MSSASRSPLGCFERSMPRVRAKRVRARTIALALVISFALTRTTRDLLAAMGLAGPMTCEEAAWILTSEESTDEQRRAATRVIYLDARSSLVNAKDRMIQLWELQKSKDEYDSQHAKRLFNSLYEQLRNKRELRGSNGY